jgi:DNA-binding NarL/FixJ family response regulator
VIRVLANLLGNAFKFTAEGGTVTLIAEARGDKVVFGVRDTGVGIRPEHVPHLFDRFWQAPWRTGRGSGVGLGLAIAKGFVTAHGGEIWVESEPGHGTCVWFTLPVASLRDEAGASVAAIEEAESPVLASLPRPIRIVLADDHPVFRASLQVLLERDGRFDVVGKAATGEQAVERVRSLKPHIVLMDVEMPGIDGIEATRQIMAMEEKTRVLIVTATPEDAKLMPALEAGACGFASKNASFEEIAAAIESSMRGGVAIDPAANRLLLDRFTLVKARHAESPLRSLTETEARLLGLAAQGYTSVEIGKRLFLAPTTVDSYRSRLMRKLGLAHRSSLVQFALLHGLLQEQ